jgi:hypothetical protein
MWGWQAWAQGAEIGEEPSELVDTGLYEQLLVDEIPGGSYYPYEEVGGAAYIPKQIGLQE